MYFYVKILCNNFTTIFLSTKNIVKNYKERIAGFARRFFRRLGGHEREGCQSCENDKKHPRIIFLSLQNFRTRVLNFKIWDFSKILRKNGMT